MKPRWIYFALAAVVAPMLRIAAAQALDVPPFQGRVNDIAAMMSERTVAQLEDRLSQFESQPGHQIAVLTIPSLQGDSLEDFTMRVAEAWKVGRKGADNGVILFVARDDRKIRIEVGYGLEGALPDATANRIIQEVIIPRFRERDFAGGIEAGTVAIMQAIGGQPALEETKRSRSSANSSASIYFTLLAVAVFVGSVLGFGQPTLSHAAIVAGGISGVIGLRTIAIVGAPFWLFASLIGAVASALTVHFTRQAWGRSWSVKATGYSDYSPRDMLFRVYRSTGGGGNGSGGGFGGRGGGGFGGGGASGGW